MLKKTIACEIPRTGSTSTSAVARHSNSIDQAGDKNEQSDGGSPEIFVQERTELDRLLEKHCCLKCNKVGIGKMLVCTEIGCPVAIHEDCLIPKANYDDLGNFHCPYCSYKRAVDQVERFRAKAMSAKKELSKFLKVADADSFGGKESENEKKEKAASPPQSEPINQHVEEIQLKQHIDQNMAAATEKCDLETRNVEEEAAVRKEHKKIGSSGKANKEAVESTIGNAFEFDAGGNEEHENHESHNVCVSVPQGSEDADQNANPSKSKTNVRKNPSHKKKQYNVLPSQRKRRRLMWTDEEEKMLKDGVQIFLERNTKKVPWRTILKLGSNVFHQSRGPVDLQNKWKNMTRKN